MKRVRNKMTSVTVMAQYTNVHHTIDTDIIFACKGMARCSLKLRM